ncbi:MAG: hypothetical protein QME54_07560, partial [Actinomycetota bacterium]|nr:hypothetical protein [Actinomycetota bacterium]
LAPLSKVEAKSLWVEDCPKEAEVDGAPINIGRPMPLAYLQKCGPLARDKTRRNALLSEAKAIFEEKTLEPAQEKLKAFLSRWRREEPEVCQSILRASGFGLNHLTYLISFPLREGPQATWSGQTENLGGCIGPWRSFVRNVTSRPISISGGRR